VPTQVRRSRLMSPSPPERRSEAAPLVTPVSAHHRKEAS